MEQIKKITKKEALEIAHNISNDNLETMFMNAMEGIEEWGETSYVNKGMTKGTSWNILAQNFDPEEKYGYSAKCNMVREFGNFLPEDLRVKNPPESIFKVNVIHQEPNFDNWV